MSILSESTVATNLEVDTWEEGIRATGALLLNIGAIEPKYIDKMIENVHRFGPYIVVGKGIALAHARPEDGVNFEGISLATLKNPVRFGHATNDPVKIIVVLASSSNGGHLTNLQRLATELGNKESLLKLVKTNDRQEIVSLINGEPSGKV